MLIPSIDVYATGSMHNAFTIKQQSHVDHSSRLVLKKSQITTTGHAKMGHTGAHGDLLTGIPG